MAEFINHLIKPYLQFCRSDPVISQELLAYPKQQSALVIFDQHWSHLDTETIAAFKRLDCDTSPLYAGSTDLFCALDVGICKPLKTFIRSKFEQYCASTVASQLSANVSPANVKINLALSVLKPMAGQWIASCYNYLRDNESDLVSGAWKGVADNLQKYLPQHSDSLPPITLSPTKCVSKFINSRSSVPPTPTKPVSSPTKSLSLPLSSSSASVPDPIISTPPHTQELLLPDVDPELNEDEEQADDEEVNNDRNNEEESAEALSDNTSDEYAPTALIGRRISVFWSDADGRRWEDGLIKEQQSNVKFIVTYDFLLQEQRLDEDVDPDVIENLLGKKAVKWRFTE